MQAGRQAVGARASLSGTSTLRTVMSSEPEARPQSCSVLSGGTRRALVDCALPGVLEALHPAAHERFGLPPKVSLQACNRDCAAALRSLVRHACLSRCKQDVVRRFSSKPAAQSSPTSASLRTQDVPD